MSPHARSLLAYIGALGLIGLTVFMFIGSPAPSASSTPPGKTGQTASVFDTAHTDTIGPAADSKTQENKAILGPSPQPAEQKNLALLPPQAPPVQKTEGVITRIENPYPVPPESFNLVNEQARAALVNILCSTGNGSLRPTSGSGVIIDPRGIILTNAHVAQYVLLAQSGKVNLSCVVRSGAPARTIANVEVLYIPPVWIENHAVDITNTNPTGTGEHDYALLYIPGPSTNHPFLLPDTREAIGFEGDPVLAASYPAEFIGGLAAQNELQPVSSITSIQELLTFETSTADLLSFAGVIEAQSGSSGGPIVNAWGRLIGIITTTSAGTTTGERELRAITLSYISRDLATQTGLDLATTINGDVAAQTVKFAAEQGPILAQQLLQEIAKRSH